MGLTRQQERVARMLAKGFTLAESARAVGIGARQVERWNSPTKGVPGFRARVEQLKEENPEPEADEMLRAALSATKRDGSPDWMVIIAAAKALKMTPPDPAAANGPEVYQVHMPVIYVDRTTNEMVEPTEDEMIEAAGMIEAEYTEIPPDPKTRATASCHPHRRLTDEHVQPGVQDELLGNESLPNRCSSPSVRAVNRWNLLHI